MSGHRIDLSPYMRRQAVQGAQVNATSAGVEVSQPGLAGMLAVTAGALDDFGKVFGELEQAADEDLLANTLLDAQERTLQLSVDVEAQPDPSAAKNMHGLGQKNIRESAREKLKTRPDLQKEFDQRFRLFAMRNNLGMGQVILGKERQVQVANFEKRIRESGKLYSLDPMNNASITSSLIADADKLAATGTITPVEKERQVARIIGQVEPDAWKNTLWGMAANGRAQEAAALTGGAMMAGDAASFVAGKESDRNPAAIGYDENGGTSYGAFQIASKPGSMDMFFDWLANNGLGSAAQVLKASGPANTGGKTGATVDVWKQLAQDGILTYEVQRKFIEDTHVKPALAKLPPEQRKLITSDPGLMSAAFSTAVQHGPNGAHKLIARAFESSDGTRGSIINKLYDERGTQFGSSTLEIEASVKARHARERQEVLAMDGTGFNANAARIREVMPQDDLFILHSKLTKLATTQNKAAREQAFAATYSNAWALSDGMNNEDRDAFMADYALKLPSADMRESFWKSYEDDKRILKARQGSTDATLRRDFLAESEGKSMADKMTALSGLREKGMSEDAITSLQKEVVSGPTWDDPDAVQLVEDKIRDGLYLDKGDFLRDVGGMQITSSRRTDLEKLLDTVQGYKGQGFERMLKDFTDNLEAFGVSKEEKPSFVLALNAAIASAEEEHKRKLTKVELDNLIQELLVEVTKTGSRDRVRVFEAMNIVPTAAMPSINQAAREALDRQGISRAVTPYDMARIWNLPENEELRRRYSVETRLGIPTNEERGEEERISVLMLEQGVQP